MNEGSFDSLDVGMIDSTVHVLRWGGDARLFVEKRPLRNGATLRAIARSRTQHESRALSKFNVLAEREVEVGGIAMLEVAAFFRDETDIVYQRRTHIIRPPWAFTFTLRGDMASRADLDARMDRLLTTLRYRTDV
jgi:hypothetical protein